MNRWIIILLILMLPLISVAQIEEPSLGGGGADADSIKGIPVQDTTSNLTDNRMLRYNLANNQWEYEDVPGAAGGEINTASNRGIEADSIFYRKNNFDLEFRRLIGLGEVSVAASGDTALSITGSAHTVLDDSLLGTGEAAAIYETITNVGKIGDDTTNFKTAFGWGDHAGLYPTTADFGKVTDDTTNWNTAFSWGDHAGLYATVADFGKVTDDTVKWDSLYTIDSMRVTEGELEDSLDAYSLTTDIASNYQPLEATLTDIADGTISENLVNTANPWADNEVASSGTWNTVATRFDTNYVELTAANLITDTLFSDSIMTDTLVVNNLIVMPAGSIGDNEIDYSAVTLADFDYQTNWSLFYSDGSGDVQELDMSTQNGEFLRSNGSAAPSFEPGGSGETNILADTGTFDEASGFGLTRTKAGVELRIAGLIEGSNITITKAGTGVNDTALIISAAGGSGVWAEGTDSLFAIDSDGDTMAVFWDDDAGNVRWQVATEDQTLRAEFDSLGIGGDLFAYLDGKGLIVSGDSLLADTAWLNANWQIATAYLADRATGDASGNAITSTYETITNVGLIGDDTTNFKAAYAIANALDSFSRIPKSRAYFDTITGVAEDSLRVVFADSSDLSIFNTDDLTQGASNLYNQTHTGDVTGATELTIASNAIESTMIAADQVNDLDINWGTGADQVEITDMPATNWRAFYSNGSNTIVELGLGSSGTYLKSNGAAVAPTWDTPAGSSPWTTNGDTTLRVDAETDTTLIIYDDDAGNVRIETGGLQTISALLDTIIVNIPMKGVNNADSVLITQGSVYPVLNGETPATGEIAYFDANDSIYFAPPPAGLTEGTDSLFAIDSDGDTMLTLWDDDAGNVHLQAAIEDQTLYALFDTISVGGDVIKEFAGNGLTVTAGDLNVDFDSSDVADEIGDSLTEVWSDLNTVDSIELNDTELYEYIADHSGSMFTGNTETGISVTYDDGDNTTDFVISAVSGLTIDGNNALVIKPGNGLDTTGGTVFALFDSSDVADEIGDSLSEVWTDLNSVDSTEVIDGNLSMDDINWRYKKYFLDVVHGWNRPLEDSIYLSLPVHDGTSSWLLSDSAGNLTAASADTFMISGVVPESCTVESLLICYQTSNAASYIDSLNLYGPDRSVYTNLTDSSYYVYTTNLTSTSWAIVSLDVTDWEASAGDRYALKVYNYFDNTDNRCIKIGWVALVTKR